MASPHLERLASALRNALADWQETRSRNILERALKELDEALVYEREELYRKNARRGGHREIYSDDIVVAERACIELTSHAGENGAWVHAKFWISAASAGDDGDFGEN